MKSIPMSGGDIPSPSPKMVMVVESEIKGGKLMEEYMEILVERSHRW